MHLDDAEPDELLDDGPGLLKHDLEGDPVDICEDAVQFIGADRLLQQFPQEQTRAGQDHRVSAVQRQRHHITCGAPPENLLRPD